MLNRAQMEQAWVHDWNDQGVNQRFDQYSEVYTVKPEIWKAAEMGEMDGCLCIGCLAKRLGRRLTAKDFPRNDPLNFIAVGTQRLLDRRSS
jgi:hypothetical protein